MLNVQHQQLESGCSIVYKGPVIMGAEDSAVEKHWIIVSNQWNGERLVFLTDNGTMQ